MIEHNKQPRLAILNARVLTMTESDASDPGALPCASVLIDRGVIAEIKADGQGTWDQIDETIEAEGRVLMPGFVDCHTHACWGGGDDHRLDEWEQKQAGASYLDILAAGDGIMATVRATRAASVDELTDALVARLDRILHAGTTTIEIKSGYGLDTATELKMLDAICRAADQWQGTAVPTALIGHAIDPDQADFVQRTIEETLPAVSQAHPGITIDAYCESGAWSLEQSLALFEAARKSGHQIRVHADQFNDLGMIPEAINRGFTSVDHLEASTPAHLDQLAASWVSGVMLPCSGFHLDDRYADGKRFVDAGGKLCIASNLNPGSSPCGSMAVTVAMAVRKLGITAGQALVACTKNPALLLNLHDRGVVQVDRRADLVLLCHKDERRLGYDFGLDPIDAVICGGWRVR